jgi:hypothetical protein
MFFRFALILLTFLATTLAHAAEPTIHIDAAHELHRVSPLLTGACIEDVNHEIYGGLYSQMLFGESFQEPAPVPQAEGFTTYGVAWPVEDGVAVSPRGDGNKLVADDLRVADGEASVKVRFDDASAGNAGLIVRVANARPGADAFHGYEISLNVADQRVLLGRHRNDWKPLRDLPCEVAVGKWIELRAVYRGPRIAIYVDGVERLTYEDRELLALNEGLVGIRQWQRSAKFRDLRIEPASKPASDLPFVAANADEANAVSGMWRSVVVDAKAEFRLTKDRPFVGRQSQTIAMLEGRGSVGVENRGLNRWGLSFQEGKEYEGTVYARSETACELWVSAESGDGSKVLDERPLRVEPGAWRRLDFTLLPDKSIENGRFAIRLKRPGTATLGYAFLQPGEWGRFEGLPVRGDVARALIDQGVTILRYGGSMVNNPGYRWKNMIGPRAERPPYRGHWYPYSTDGWGILDFMNFCEAAGFEYVPTFHFGETPEDMADFVRYATAPVDAEWGRKRAEDGHPQPYRLKYLQLGNEERVDQAYAERFERLAEAIWSANKSIRLIVGDFVYEDPIVDPNHVTGAASGITTLDGQRRILAFAKRHDQEVWFDVHVWTDGPKPARSFDAMFSYLDALERIADGAKFRVLTFEFNSNNHSQKRALANALAIQAIERDGRLPIASSANALQPDGQNDNGWNQGLVFLSPSQVWLQPPGYVTQMFSRGYRPRLVECRVAEDKELDCNAKLSDDGKSLVLSIVSTAVESRTVSIRLAGFTPTASNAQIVELAGELDAANTAADPRRIAPTTREWTHDLADGAGELTLPPYSVTTVTFR